MNIADGGNPGAQVEELVDPEAGQQVDDTAQERPIRRGEVARVRPYGHRLLGEPSIGGEVVRSAQIVVIHAGSARPLDIHVLRRPVRALGHRFPFDYGLICSPYGTRGGSE